MRCLPVRSQEVAELVNGKRDLLFLPFAVPDGAAAVVSRPWTRHSFAVLDEHGNFMVKVDVPYLVGQRVYLAEEWGLVDGEIRRRSGCNGTSKPNITWARPEWMPPDLSPQRLEVTSVSPQRLREICAADVRRAGCRHPKVDDEHIIRVFALAWNAVHDHPMRWAADPFVWRLEVTRIRKTGDETTCRIEARIA